MLDFISYDASKKDGGVILQKIGANAVVFIRKFHPNTGVELTADMGPVDVQAILKQRTGQAKILAGIDSFLADIKELGVDISPVKPE